jgi:membrane protein YdbS with pleckstrin-like domain
MMREHCLDRRGLALSAAAIAIAISAVPVAAADKVRDQVLDQALPRDG